MAANPFACATPPIEDFAMSDAYIVQVGGHTAGIVVRDRQAETFSFFAATHAFNALEGMQFPVPHAAERAARELIAKSRPIRPTNAAP